MFYLRNRNLNTKWKTFDPETCQNSWQLWGPDATYGTGDEVSFLFVVVVIVVCFLVVCGVDVVDVVVKIEVKSLFVVFLEQQDFLEITAGLDSEYQVVCCGNTQSITWLRTKVCFVFSANNKAKSMFCLLLQIFTVLCTYVYCRRPVPLTWLTMWALRWIILNIY